MKGLRADAGIVLRTPLLAMTGLPAWAAGTDEAAARRYLLALVARPDVREAIFLASPSLHAELDRWRASPLSEAGQRVEPAITRYVARMMGRATPFGLFSGVSAGRLETTTQLELAPIAEYRRRTRLDNDYLFLLLEELGRDPSVRARLRYRRNTSIYRAGGRVRYAYARLEGKKRHYHLVAVESTPHLEAVLASAAGGAHRAQLAATLVDDTISEEMAQAFVDELIDAQLLIPELAVNVTGAEPLDGALEQLARAGLDDVRDVLARVRAGLAAIDGHGLGHLPARYVELAAELERLPADVELARLFQVDMIKPARATVARTVAATVASTIARLAELTRPATTFDAWKRMFRDRWDGRWVPLAEALDEESGIGFETERGPGSEGAPLIAGLPLDGVRGEQQVPWSSYESHLARRLGQALAAGDHEISLTDADLETMRAPAPPPLPDAFSALIRLAGSREDPTILLESMSGPSGARLLGRFCHASREIDEMVRAHHAGEEAHRPDAVYAEIVHLNDGRIGNILCRPVLRDHEVVYLGVSGASAEKQLPVEDLLVGLDGDRIVLWSRRLDREVVPRLSTAHNFRLHSLCVYRFLCALASQGVGLAAFSWGPLAASPFLPRVRLDRVIVHRARWNLDGRELTAITTAVRAAAKRPELRAAVLDSVKALRASRKLPRMFVIEDGDNELPIDLDNPLLARAFADEVSGASRITLTELFPLPDELVVTGPEGGFANEVVMTFTQAPRREPERPSRARAGVSPAERVFGPGSEWLFAKIYCGEGTADRVLGDAIAPVVRDAMARGTARQWFFIRYRDPDSHLRLRFHGDPARLVGEVLPALHAAIEPHVATGAVHKLVLDTYVREIDRYGGPRGLELVEQIFWRDSEAVLAIVQLLDGDAGAVARWKLALRGIDSMLEALGLSEAERAHVASAGRAALGAELRAGPALWRDIGQRFARERADLELVFDRDPVRDAAHEYAEGFTELSRRDSAIATLAADLRRRESAGELTSKLVDFAWSIVHMHANRMLHASQRAQELVLYDFLRRLHAARTARRAVSSPGR